MGWKEEWLCDEKTTTEKLSWDEKISRIIEKPKIYLRRGESAKNRSKKRNH